MMLVKTKLKESDLHGIGIYANEFIPKGTEVWRFTPGFDLRFTAEEVLKFNDLLQTFLYKYSWKGKVSGLQVLTSDNTRFLNHSNTPNLLVEYREGEEEPIMVAGQDMESDQEYLINYNDLEFSESEDAQNIMDKIAERLHLNDELDPWLK